MRRSPLHRRTLRRSTPGRSTLRRSTLALPALIVLGVAFWSSPAQPQAASGDAQFQQYKQRFHGVWRRSTPEARARQVVDRAIEQAVDAMNFFARPLARSQLKDNTPLNPRIDLLFGDDGRITVMFDGDAQRRYTSRPGRTVRVSSPGGDAMRMTQRFHDDGRLEQVFETDLGTRWNVYQATGDGQMRLSATSQGMMMPQPVHFTFDYARR